MPISERARDLIVAAEVTSEDVYKAKYRRPEWPGGGSGVTVGIGYDLGMADRAKIIRDWQDRVSPEMLKVMASCAGVSGSAAKSLCAKVRNQILIEWDDAIAVFDDVDVPAWEKQVIRKIPKAADLNEDCLGVLVSLAYNRGASFDNSGDRYREMRAIKADVQSGNLDDVATQLRSMKRLWPDARGLRVRREDEAKLWEEGLESGDAAPARLISGDDRTIPADDETVTDLISTVTPVAATGAGMLKSKPPAITQTGVETVVQNAAKPLYKAKQTWLAGAIATISSWFGFDKVDASFLEKAKAFVTSPGFLFLVIIGLCVWMVYLRWSDHGRGALKMEN